MAKEIIEAEIKSNVGKFADDAERAAEAVEKIGKSSDVATKGVDDTGSSFKKLGLAIKAAGIGLLLGLLATLKDVFSKNQTVVDGFNTTMTSLSIAFNDLFSFLQNNVGTVIGYFKSIFEDPKAAIQGLIDDGIARVKESFNSLLDTLGYLGDAFQKLFARDFAGALDSVKKAGKESIDIITGVDNTVDKVVKTTTNATKAIVNYTKSTIDQAQSITETEKAAARANVKFAELNAQYLKDAEVQRQIRDDETKTFQERIEANEELSRVLAKQQKLQKEQIQTQIDAAQAQFDINDSEENFIALQLEKTKLLDLEEQITGQLSEQKTNQVSLEKELLEAQNEIRQEGLSGFDRELLELENSYQQKLDLARKSGMDTTAIEKQFAKQKSQIVQNQVNEQLSAVSGLAGALSSLAGESKELAIAQAIIDTYVGANKAIAQGGVAGILTGAAVIIAGLANVKKIMQQDVGTGSGGGSVPSATPSTPAPQMLSGAFDLTGVQAPEPIQAYVVTDDMTNSQDKLATIRRRATI
tara:strand:- start:876 stop:2456 length:1581 start_codon:yes stop_codon:yes gene_type:complete